MDFDRKHSFLQCTNNYYKAIVIKTRLYKLKATNKKGRMSTLTISMHNYTINSSKHNDCTQIFLQRLIFISLWFLGVTLLNTMISICLISLKYYQVKIFSSVFSPDMYWRSSCFCLFISVWSCQGFLISHFNYYVVIAQCSFNLNFPND